MRKLFSLLIVLGVAFAYGCGSGGSGSLGAGGGGTGGGGTGGGDDDGGDDGGTGSVQFGSGTGSGFMPGVIEIALSDLPAGGSTPLTVTIVDENGDPVTGDPIDISFSSVCSGQGLATIDSPVTANNGIANSNYVATGCDEENGDVITATAAVEGEELTASGVVMVASASVGSIEFVSATPTNIGLQGTGGSGRSETSIVVFRVVDSSGGPVNDADVSFTLNTNVGGIGISPIIQPTGANGQVQTVVEAGTVATTVRVTARIDTPEGTIATQSDQLTITTGVPDKDSTSLSVETLNTETLFTDGVTVPVTIRLSDRFNNPVPDGTAITFQTEGAQIGGQCTTVDGTCTVNWVSQNPRPSDGRSTLLATAIGEESFTDSNGNGVFDNADTVFDDIPEPFRDDNENGFREPTEPFVDFDVDGNYDEADGFFNGLLCQHDTLCSSTTSVGVFDSSVIIMSDSVPDASDYPECIQVPEGITISEDILIQDSNNQPLPAGTTIDFETTYGSILSPSTFTYPNTTAPQSFSVIIEGDAMAGSGFLFITTTTPGDVEATSGVRIENVCPP